MHNSISRPRASSRGRSPTTSVRRANAIGTGARPLRALLAILIASAASSAHALDAPSFAALLQQAQAGAPQLLEQAANTRAAAADVRQASAWRNPSLNASAENIGTPRQDGASQREDTYSVTQIFELGGNRAARVAAEQRKADAAGARERQARLTYAADLAVAYATAEAMQQRQVVADAELARARDDLRAARALVQSGREAELRLAQAQASAAAADAALQAAMADTTGAFERLSALVGAAEPYTRIVHPLLGSSTTAAPDAGWTPVNAPALAAAAAERDALAAQVAVEQKRWLPEVGVTLGMRKYGWTDQKGATIGLSATIPLFDRNQGGVDAARERANAAAMRLEATRLEAIAAHRSARAQVQAAERVLQAAEQGETAAGQAYRLGRIGYDAGKTPLVELLAIRRALSEASARTIEARLARVRALAALSLAEGRPVFGEAP